MTEPRSIYLDPVDPMTKSLQERKQLFASELRTCEDLIVMGYRFSHQVKLEERARYLEITIKRIEELMKSQVG